MRFLPSFRRETDCLFSTGDESLLLLLVLLLASRVVPPFPPCWPAIGMAKDEVAFNRKGDPDWTDEMLFLACTICDCCCCCCCFSRSSSKAIWRTSSTTSKVLCIGCCSRRRCCA